MNKPVAAPHIEELDLSGRRVADFQVLRKLGQGGMGQVYLAEQISLKRKVALKILRPELAASPEALKRFKAEAEAVARITHANIVQVYAFDEKGDPPYMALEYVEGRNLREFVSKKGPPELLVALSIMRQVATALQRAAEAGIIHRDIKPENILLTRKGEVKVADFGLSRCLEGNKPALNLTQTGVTMGTPLYMSPEQVEGKPVDPRTDIYSFGVTCYHMLAGHPPFRGSTAFEVALQHVRQAPQPLFEVRPDLPEALCAIVHKMMAKAPDQRYQTGRELMRDIARLRESLTGVNPVVGLPTIQVEAVPAASLGVVADGGQTQPVSVPPPPVPAPMPSGVFWMSIVALSLIGAAGAGAAYAWHERSSDKGVHPGEAAATDRVKRPSKREKELRESAESYLVGDPAGGGGPAVCMDLGLFYLEEGQFAEAREVFQRMERYTERPAYFQLGRFGKGISLALQNKPQEAKDVFQALIPRKGTGGRPKGGGRGPYQHIVALLDSSPRWAYFFGKALWAIRANSRPGQGETKLPSWVAQKAAPFSLFEKK
jgi:serine/threonine-protein kinase